MCAIAIIVLGSPNDEQGNLLPIAYSRCNQALAEFEKNPASKVLCTGGFGPHFNTTDIPHAHYAQQYLQAQGIPPDAFLEWAVSAFTIEDATLSKPILENNGIKQIILVTSDFHMERALLIFERVCPELTIDCVPAPSDLPEDELNQRIAHESTAIKRDLENLRKFHQIR